MRAGKNAPTKRARKGEVTSYRPQPQFPLVGEKPSTSDPPIRRRGLAIRRNVDCMPRPAGSNESAAMDTPLTFLGIAGSLRRASYNRAALRAAQALVPDNVTLAIHDIGTLPLFNQDSETAPPPALVDFKRAIRAADAIVIATPEYNYSIPGVLKNAIDCASRPYGDSAWTGKPVAVMGAS